METPLDRSPASRRIEPSRGDVLGGKYRLVRALGQGGMGTVFEAENLITLRRAAVKWLHPRYAPNELAQQRMLREARATSRIRHRHVVDLYDVVLEHDAVVLVMELLTGEVLSERLQREPTSLPQLLRWLVAAMEGVAAAHDVGVIHRDIKPANIFLVSSEQHPDVVPKVIDFGISKLHDGDASRLTNSGVAMGTPRYMSFEQLRCDPSLDARSDVYAFGVILYEAMVGRAPYEGASFGEQAVAFITRDPALPRALRPELPEALSALVYRAISRERQERHASMRELIDALRPFCDERAWPVRLDVWRGPAALPEGAANAESGTQPASSTPPARQRRPRRASWALLLGVALCGSTALLPMTRSKDASPRPAPEQVRSRQPIAPPATALPPAVTVVQEAPAHADAGVARMRTRRHVAPVASAPIAVPTAVPSEENVSVARRVHRAGPVARDEF